MDPKLTINVRRAAEGAAVLEIHGELTRLAEKPLDTAYAEAVGWPRVRSCWTSAA